MLSLFSSVGICRILRYGSSNTSTVEQRVCPRFFSGPSKFGEMRRCERKMLKCNAELVDIVFRLMFETFWVAPYDLRRDFPVLVNFERHARRCVGAVGYNRLRLGLRGADIRIGQDRRSARPGRPADRRSAAVFARGVCRGAGNWSDASGMRCLRPAPPGLRRLFRHDFGIAAGCRLRPAPATVGRRDSVIAPFAFRFGITALRDLLGWLRQKPEKPEPV